MTSDEQLTRDIGYELGHDTRVDAVHLHVAVQDGAAVLSGSAPNLASKQAALAAARRVTGVRRVFDGIAVDTSLDGPADGEIAERVRAILALDAAVPPGAIEVDVAEGRVTLTGSVDWGYQREAARSAAARISGAVAVLDRIEVAGPPSVSDIRGRILAALEHLVESETSALTIEIEQGVVRLAGSLDGAACREAAVQATRTAPGVVSVENELEAS